jgi:penicillin amidase
MAGSFQRPLWRALFRTLLGRRLPTTEGSVASQHLSASVRVDRDIYGIPHIAAQTDQDAWFALGFCEGQDRAFQLEGLVRVVRGTLAEMVGPDAVGIDRLARRLGFRRSAELQLKMLEARARDSLQAFAAGVTEGLRKGAPRPHELVLIRTGPSPWEAADVLGVAKVMGLFLSANWDLELARLRILEEDGPGALAALHPAHAQEPPLEWAGDESIVPAIDQLMADLVALVGSGGSNNWALAPARTASGRPLVANDVHLEPTLPNPFYLAHTATPKWAVVGAVLVGTPVVVAGHNGTLAWGITAGLADNTDLFVEQFEPGRTAVRGVAGPEPCECRRELIEVRGASPVTTEVVVTPRGPIVGLAPEASSLALSLRATWLQPHPISGLLDAYRARSCAELCAALRLWPSVSLNVVSADHSGSIAWQLAGDVPVRSCGLGTIPRAAWLPGGAWEDSPVAFESMPRSVDPPEGFVATANNEPASRHSRPFLGADWVDGYRRARITESLCARRDWDAPASSYLQLDLFSIPWREMRTHVLSAACATRAARRARELLATWDGTVSAESSAATVFELFVSEMLRRLIAAKAAGVTRWRAAPLTRVSAVGMRPTELLVELMSRRAEGWFERPWPEEIGAALDQVGRHLVAEYGDAPERWGWGRVRPLWLRHPVGRRGPLHYLFDLGPFPWGGDANTVSQAATPPLDPTGNPLFVASMRMVVDVGAWDSATFVLAGGQSGNPLSPHYADQIPLWRAGRGIAIGWTPEAVERTTVRTLTLAGRPG